MQGPHAPKDKRIEHGRVEVIDEVRGFSTISMIVFHALYDLLYLCGLSLPFFENGGIQEVWRISISWTFLALAGWSTSFSSDNLRRACEYGGFAALIWIVTSFAGIDTPISFGIIFCMASSTLVWAVLERAIPHRIDDAPYALAGISLLLFLLTYAIPRAHYGFPGLSWLGFPTPQFQSGDYYPMIPFSFLYLSAALAARGFSLSGRSYQSWMMKRRVPLLSFVGRHALVAYAIHQPLLLAIIQALGLL